MMRAFVGHTDNFDDLLCFFWHGGIALVGTAMGHDFDAQKQPTLDPLLYSSGALSAILWARGRVREDLART